MPKYKGSHKTANGINYVPTSMVEDELGNDAVANNSNNLDTSIEERYFAFESHLVYGKSGTVGGAIPPGIPSTDTWQPMTYLQIPTTQLQHIIDGDPENNAFAKCAIYVTGIITIKENAETWNVSLEPDPGNPQFGITKPAIAESYLFEHYGIVSPTRPNAGQFAFQGFNNNGAYQIFNSEFVVLKKLDTPSTTSNTVYPTPGETVLNQPVTTFPSLVSTSTIDHPIKFDYLTSTFKCKITPFNIVQSKFSPVSNPTIFVKGTYLLM